MNAATLAPLLPNLCASDLAQLFETSRERQFAAGEWLYREGDEADSCLLVVTGLVHVMKRLDGADRVLGTLQPGTFVGQMALVVENAQRTASVCAARTCEALELTREDFQHLLEAHHPFALHLQEQVAIAGIRQLRAATERMALLLCNAMQSGDWMNPPPLDREGLARIQAGTSEWELQLQDHPVAKANKSAS